MADVGLKEGHGFLQWTIGPFRNDPLRSATRAFFCQHRILTVLGRQDLGGSTVGF